MAWPVKDSSTIALSLPVWPHCWTNFAFERRVTVRMVQSDTGMEMMATSASNGEITTIITIVPTSVRSDVSSWLSVCWRLWAMLSMSLDTRLRRSPRGWSST